MVVNPKLFTTTPKKGEEQVEKAIRIEIYNYTRMDKKSINYEKGRFVALASGCFVALYPFRIFIEFKWVENFSI